METKKILENFPGHVIQYFSDAKKDGVCPETKPSLDLNYAAKKQLLGCSVCFSPNGFKNGRRTIENLTSVNAVFADLDVGKEKDAMSKEQIDDLKQAALLKLDSFTLKAHFVIETKNGLQPIWSVSNFTKADFDQVVPFLIKTFNADPGRKDVAGVLRVPGYMHLKNPNKPFLCALIETNLELPKYTVSDFLNLPSYADYIKANEISNPVSKATNNKQYSSSNEIKTAIATPLAEVLKVIPPLVNINVQLRKNNNGSMQIIENGVITSGFISSLGNFAHSTSGKNRKGNPITISQYYLNELGGNNYNAQQLANIILELINKLTK